MEIVYYRHNRGCPPLEISRHVFTIYELTLVEKGELRYLLDGREVTVRAGDAVFVTPGTVRERPATGRNADYVSFNFETSPSPELPELLHGVPQETEKAIVAAADAVAARRDGSYARQMEHLVSCLLCSLEERFRVAREHPVVSRIKQYVESHLAEPVTLTDIGRHCFFSPIYCETVFKRATGTSVIRYVTARRMEEAQKLILEGALPLRKIAESVGYPDYNYFARTFKKVTGMTPKSAAGASEVKTPSP